MARIPGEFVPLDVNYSHDRAIRAAGPLGELLFIRSLAYSRRTRSFGHLPDYDLPVIGVGIPAVAKHAAALVRHGLWDAEEGGWSIRSWEKWNPSATQAVRDKQSTGGALGNHRKWHTEGKTSPECVYCTNASVTDRSTDRSTDSVGDRSRIAEVEREGEKRERLSSEVADATVRPEVAHLLDFLDKHIEANGSKKPQRTKRNIDAARLLLDKDGRTVEQIEAAIAWCQSDEFWRANVLSMAKLREKYDQLRLAAQRQTKTSATGDRAGDILRATEQRYAAQPMTLPQIGA